MGQRLLLSFALACIIGGIGWFAVQLNQPQQELPAFTFPDLEQNSRSSREWQGQVLVVNFWATWCVPCLREMPRFAEMQKRYGEKGLRIVAISIDDPQPVREFAAEHSLNFPVLLGGEEAIALAKQMGNRITALPFTVIYDRNGNARYAKAGEITREILEQQLHPLL
jgi:thiol-disulfide isomerase/thioredoxin